MASVGGLSPDIPQIVGYLRRPPHIHKVAEVHPEIGNGFAMVSPWVAPRYPGRWRSGVPEILDIDFFGILFTICPRLAFWGVWISQVFRRCCPRISENLPPPSPRPCDSASICLPHISTHPTGQDRPTTTPPQMPLTGAVWAYVLRAALYPTFSRHHNQGGPRQLPRVSRLLCRVDLGYLFITSCPPSMQLTF